jgi:predicted Zn-dependent protease
LTQALFLGAPTQELFPLLEAIEESVPDWDPLAALYARSFLFAEQPREAENMLKMILEERPGDVLARAVFVDYQWQQGDTEQALAVAADVLEHPRMPPWLRWHLEHTIEAIESEG